VSGNSCLIKRGVVPAAVGSSGGDHMDSTTLLITCYCCSWRRFLRSWSLVLKSLISLSVLNVESATAQCI